MSTKVYVGWNTTDDSLRNAFSAYGQILDSIVMRDRDTGRSRGFGFVTYSSAGEAQTAISSLNEQELDGRRIKVNLANARGSGGGGALRLRWWRLLWRWRLLRWRWPGWLRRRRLRWWRLRLPRWLRWRSAGLPVRRRLRWQRWGLRRRLWRWSPMHFS
ncbi:hypothetical protein C8Q78DRAFT_499814 [Trametes maxima]|nr:hypothetical protein C8Q78DRAFT_499814 [Trametes maxima]